MEFKISYCTIKLFSLCGFVVSSLFQINNCNSMEAEKEDRILTRCAYPSFSSPEAGEHFSSDFFNNRKNQIDDEKRKESILMWLNRGGDKRQPILNTKEFPYSTQAYFTAIFPRTAIFTSEIGTGTFIDKDVILTAAHVVYSHEKGGYCTSLKCIPAAHERIAPYGIFSENRIVLVSPKYIEKGPDYKQYDYAIIITRSAIGERTGYLGLAALKEDTLQGIEVTIAGYPGDKIEDISSPTMWGMSGKLTTIGPEELYHDIDTYAGQSGSGIWYKMKHENKAEYLLVGIHAYGTEEKEGLYNYGPRLTKKKGEEILGWIEAFRKDPSKFKAEHHEPKHIQEHGVIVMQIGEEERFNNEETLKLLPPEVISKMNREDGLDWYEQGLGYESSKDDKLAFACFQQAFLRFQEPKNQKNREVKHKLAVMYSLGRYVNRNPYQAVILWKEAAALGHIKAMFNVALMYEKGEGVEHQSDEEAFKETFKWYMKAAIKENAEAQCYVADMSMEGKGTDKSESTAIEWYEKSANQGFEKAFQALERLADMGNTQAQEILNKIRQK
ncbi:MAG: SEL1-like repeat protein [Candidatus Paracaedibacteraceae bacterium]|nr:SEL1-like repeat protein [Candidatus Paracaedibacteraceae bacterium]